MRAYRRPSPRRWRGVAVLGLFALLVRSSVHHAPRPGVGALPTAAATSRTPVRPAEARARADTPAPARTRVLATCDRGPIRHAERAAHRPTPRRATPTPVPLHAATDDDVLADEVALLSDAEHALADDPDACLALVDRHARVFPGGELAELREWLAVRALLRLAHADAARARASSARVRFAGGVLDRGFQNVVASLQP